MLTALSSLVSAETAQRKDLTSREELTTSARTTALLETFKEAAVPTKLLHLDTHIKTTNNLMDAPMLAQSLLPQTDGTTLLVDTVATETEVDMLTTSEATVPASEATVPASEVTVLLLQLTPATEAAVLLLQLTPATLAGTVSETLEEEPVELKPAEVDPTVPAVASEEDTPATEGAHQKLPHADHHGVLDNTTQVTLVAVAVASALATAAVSVAMLTVVLLPKAVPTKDVPKNTTTVVHRNNSTRPAPDTEDLCEH